MVLSTTTLSISFRFCVCTEKQTGNYWGCARGAPESSERPAAGRGRGTHACHGVWSFRTLPRAPRDRCARRYDGALRRATTCDRAPPSCSCTGRTLPACCGHVATRPSRTVTLLLVVLHDGAAPSRCNCKSVWRCHTVTLPLHDGVSRFERSSISTARMQKGDRRQISGFLVREV